MTGNRRNGGMQRREFLRLSGVAAASTLAGWGGVGTADAQDSPHIYTLDWEDPAERLLPGSPPPFWGGEYDPNVRHDGEPQIRAARSPYEPVRSGGWSARFQLYKTDPVINGGTRCELAGSFEPVGAERWYGFSIYLPVTWIPDRAPDIVTQWHQHWDIGTSPPLSIGTRDGQWEIAQNWEGTYQNTLIGAYATGRWTDWVVHVKWSAGYDGVLDIWNDGEPVPGFFRKQGKNTYYGDGLHGNYLKLGIYKWPWSQGQVSDTARRVMYHDELRIADERGSYDDVAPATRNRRPARPVRSRAARAPRSPSPRHSRR